MTPERWQQIDSLLQNVVEVRPEERAGLLDQECAADQTLREEVESLLHFREMARTFLKTPALEEAAWLLVEDQPDLMVGLLVDRYRIDKCLGTGSMGEVYLAEDTWLDRKVAIKFLPPYLQADEVSRKRLVREAKAVARLDHANICAVYEVNKADDRSFIVMQYVTGETLDDTIKHQRLSLGSVLDIVIQILEALAEAHSHKTVHRDIKPGNIMLTPQGQVKVLDFGLAKQVGITLPEQGDQRWWGVLSRPGEHAGTPPYMSPEQVNGAVVDARSDLFAVGVILYECLSGSRPFSGATVAEIFEQVVHVDPLPLSSLNSAVSPKLAAVIVKALAKDPGARYQSANDLLMDLREVRAALPSGDVVHRLTPAPPATPLQQSSWNTLSKLARQPRSFVFAGVITLVVVLVFLLIYPPAHQPPLEAVRQYEAGTQALRNGAYFEASQAFEQAVATDSKYALAHARLAEAYAELDRSDKAKDEVILALSTSRGQRMEKSADLSLQAITSMVRRDFTSATAIYQQIANQAPAGEKGRVFLDLGRAYEKNDETDKAEESYQQAASLAPHDAVAFLRLGVLYGRQQQLKSAREAFQKAELAYRELNQPEGLAEVFYQRGFVLLNEGQLSEARTDLESALRMATEWRTLHQQIRVLLALSSVAVHEGHLDQAEAQATRAIQLAQSNRMEYLATGGLAWLGTAYRLLKNESKAEECYQQSLELARRNNGYLNEAIALVQLAVLRQEQRRTGEVLAYLDQALPFLQQGKYRKWLSQAMQIRARAYRDRGDYDAALKSFGEQLRLNEEVNDYSQVAFVNVELGNVLVMQEKFEEALGHFDKAYTLLSSLQLTVWIPYVVNNQAGVLWQLGRYREARAALDEATQMVEKVEAVHRQLFPGLLVNSALLELSDWQLGEARKHSRRALAVADKDSDIAAARYSLGLAQLRSGKGQAGRRHCEAAIEAATRAGDSELIYAATLALSEAMLESGDASQALATALGLTEKLVNTEKQSSAWQTWLIAARAGERLGNIAMAREYASRAAGQLSSIEEKWTTEAYAGYLARRDIQHFRRQLDQLLKL